VGKKSTLRLKVFVNVSARHVGQSGVIPQIFTKIDLLVVITDQAALSLL